MARWLLGSGVINSLVTLIEVGERGERGRSVIGFQLMWRTTMVYVRLMKMNVLMSENRELAGVSDDVLDGVEVGDRMGRDILA